MSTPLSAVRFVTGKFSPRSLRTQLLGFPVLFRVNFMIFFVFLFIVSLCCNSTCCASVYRTGDGLGLKVLQNARVAVLVCSHITDKHTNIHPHLTNKFKGCLQRINNYIVTE